MRKIPPLLTGPASLFLLLSLTGCAADRVVIRPEPVEIRVPVYVPLPAGLTTTVAVPALPAGDAVNDDLVELIEQHRAALSLANCRLNAVAAVTGRATNDHPEGDTPPC